jgi:aspartyl-tRNA synthetase
VIAFPKNQAGVDPMSGAPTAVEQRQLEELGIAVVVADEHGRARRGVTGLQ